MPRLKPFSYLLFFISLILYSLIAYAMLRHDTAWLFTAYFLLFGIYVWILKTAEDKEIRFWIYASILFRLSFIAALPALSDDFYRFIWDGRLLINGIHPFAELPGYYLGMGIDGIDQSLFSHLNSPEYFTIYPSFAQFIFWIAALLSPKSILGSVVVMRIFILAAEVGSIFLIQKLLRRFNVEPNNVLIYTLNPLVIIELTGNLHFEAFVILFLLLSIYSLLQSRLVLAGISFALSISAKLLPVIFLPLFLIRLGMKRAIIFYTVVGIASLFFFSPLLNSNILAGFSKSFELYFKSFEFNASIYYLFREYGFLTKGYNTIQTIGWKLGLTAAVLILLISFWPYAIHYQSMWRLKLKKYQFPESVTEVLPMMMWVMTIYFSLTTTLHPWYITTLLLLSVFTRFRFVVVWSAMIFLTYAGYSVVGFSENLYLTLLEYLVVIGYLVYELWQRKFSFN